MGKSWSSTIMEDQRITVEEAEIIAGAESVLTMPRSLAIGAEATVGDVSFQEFTPAVKETVSELIETVKLVSEKTVPTLVQTFGAAMGQTAESSMRATELIGQKLQETQLGTASILPGVAKYLLIAACVIVVAGKVLR